jgi:hypothetical protein
MPTPQPKDILFRVGGLTLERYGVATWRRAPISRGGEEGIEGFTRADGGTPVATALGRDGLYHLVAQNVLRREYLPNIDVGDGLGPRTRATLLLEGARKNLLLQSQNFGATWVPANGATRVAANASCGVLVLDLVQDTSAVQSQYYQQAVAFTGDGTKGILFHVKRDTAAISTFDLFDATALLRRFKIDITWNADGTIQATAVSAGALFDVTALAGGIYRVRAQGLGVVAANVNEARCFGAQDAGAAIVGNTNWGGIQAEDGAFPSSYILTGAATVPRAQDALTVPLGFGVRAPLTVLFRLVTPLYLNTGGPGVGIPGLVTIAGAPPNLRIWLPTAGGTVRAGLQDTVGGDVQQGTPSVVAPLVQGIVQLLPTAGGLAVAVDAGAGLSALSATIPTFQKWHDQVLHVGDLSGGVGSSAYCDLLDVVGFDGAFSRADCLAVP